MRPIPLPSIGVTQWVQQCYSYLIDLQKEIETPGPKVIQLEHKKISAKATRDGLLMWEPISHQVVVSKGGAWYALTMGTVPVTTGLDG